MFKKISIRVIVLFGYLKKKITDVNLQNDIDEMSTKEVWRCQREKVDLRKKAV
jgi:predicted oxidoreductase (fatty acid repression mutant protein)